MKAYVTAIIENYVREYEKTSATKWGRPLVGFADAAHPMLPELRVVADKNHVMPQKVLEDAAIVVCYFLPFTRETAKSNIGDGHASPEWARAYEDTNALFTIARGHNL